MSYGKQKRGQSRFIAGGIVAWAIFLVMVGVVLRSFVGRFRGGEISPGAAPMPCAAGAVEISIAYMPLDDERYMPTVIEQFNQAYVDGKNPVTGQALAAGEKPICITGKEGSSGTMMQGIVNAVIAPNNQNVERPTLFQPAVSHWLTLANYYSGQSLFDPAEIQPIALAPVVIAIWKSRLDAIRQTVGYDEIGWEELLAVLNSPNGWQDYGIPNGRRAVYYGHTNPYVSSTGLSTLIAEFYASARQNNFTGRSLDLATVNDAQVQQGVRDIEAMIRHYSTRTTEFKHFIAQGPDYVDFAALPENNLIYINRFLKPPEQLVTLYPKEGTFWHEHPFGIVHADWVTPEQAAAARVFTQYALTPEVQRLIMSRGFRPANTDVALADPIIPENGIAVDGPATTLNVPSADVVAAIQQSWSFVKKQADILLVIDTSGSMGAAGKIDQAKQAAHVFLDGMEASNRVGLVTFSDAVYDLVPMGKIETIKGQLHSAVDGLTANGGTALYRAVQDTVSRMNADDAQDRIRVVVVLSDGQDTASPISVNDVVQSINASHDDLNPVILFLVAYGADADVVTLNTLARASATQVQSGDPATISGLLVNISSYF